MSDEDQTTDEQGGEGSDDGPVDQAAVDNMFDDPPAASESAEEQPMGLNEIEAAEGAETSVDQEFAIGEPMASDVTAIYDIPVQISAVLGRSTMQVSQLLKLGRGAVVELDRKVGEAIDIYVNNRLVARGEVVVVEDKLGVTMTEIVKSDRS